MKRYSQRQEGYNKIKLGTCSRNNLETDGCFVCSLSMLAYQDPQITNAEFTQQGVYLSGCSIVSNSAARVLGLDYDGKEYSKKPSFICIAETLDYDRPSTDFKEQHFFVFAPKGTVNEHSDMMLDPLALPSEMTWEPVKYKIKSYRLFHEKKQYTEEFEQAWQEMIDEGIYSDKTEHGKPVTTDQLAVFFSRIKSNHNHL